MRCGFVRLGLGQAGKRTQVFAVFLIFLLGLGAVPVSAQNIDWLVNIDDDPSDPTNAGGTILYTVTVTNNGILTAPATTLSLDIPTGTEMDQAGGGNIVNCLPASVVGPGTVTCDVPTLIQDQVESVVVEVVAYAAGTVTLGASVPEAGDDQTGNNAVSEGTTVVSGADLGLEITGPASVASGDTITYTLDITNKGPDAASDIDVNFPVPTGVVFLGAPAGCSPGGGGYNCTVSGPLGVSDSVSFDFDAQVYAASSSSRSWLLFWR